MDQPETPNGAKSEKKQKEKRFQCATCQRMFARLEHLQVLPNPLELLARFDRGLDIHSNHVADCRLSSPET